MSFEVKLIINNNSNIINCISKGLINLNNSKNLNFENKVEEISYYAYKGYDCYWKSNNLFFYGIQLYIVEFHHRSDLYNFPTIYDKND